MESKKALDDMYNIAISNSGDFEKADKIRECYNKIADDLEILEEIRISYIVFKDGDDYFLRTGKGLYFSRVFRRYPDPDRCACHLVSDSESDDTKESHQADPAHFRQHEAVCAQQQCES